MAKQETTVQFTFIIRSKLAYPGFYFGQGRFSPSYSAPGALQVLQEPDWLAKSQETAPAYQSACFAGIIYDRTA
jgi:hypothetical protein